jgi:hypothetical protein
MDASTFIALLSLVVSGVVAWFTYRFSWTQHRLNEILLYEKIAEREEAKKAIFAVKLEKSSSDYTLFIQNVGAGPATDVFFSSAGPVNEFVGAVRTQNPLLHFPLALVEPGKVLSFRYMRYLEHTHQPTFTLRWNDKKGEHEQTYEPPVPR